MGNYFLCSKSEVPALVEQANAEAAQILKEFAMFYTTAGTLRIEPIPKQFYRGWSIAGRLWWDDKVLLEEEYVDLIFLHLNEMMLRRMIQLGIPSKGAAP